MNTFKPNIPLLLATLVVVVSFFLPWVSVDSAAVGGISKLLTGKKQETIDSISAFDVPIMANGKESRLMISVIKIFNPDIKDADKKSWLIWIVPLMAIIFFVLNMKIHSKWLNLGLAVIGIAIFAVGAFKILTTDLDKLVLAIRINLGLWLTLVGYGAIGVFNILDFARKHKKT